MASEHIRNFIMGTEKYVWSEGLEIIEKSIEHAGNPPNISTDIRLLKEFMRGYRWALQRGYIGD